MNKFHHIRTIASLLLLAVLLSCRHKALVTDPTYVVQQTSVENTFIVQIPPKKNISDLLKDLGCGEKFICAVGDAEILVIRRKVEH